MEDSPSASVELSVRFSKDIGATGGEDDDGTAERSEDEGCVAGSGEVSASVALTDSFALLSERSIVRLSEAIGASSGNDDDPAEEFVGRGCVGGAEEGSTSVEVIVVFLPISGELCV